MAAEIRRRLILEQSRKRQRLTHAPKLLPNEQVEVRSVEEGFQGSWHQGTVIECRTQIRIVKYDHLLNEDSSENLVEFIPVLFAVDGIIPVNWKPSDFPNYRGKIRPIPPRVFYNEANLRYGQCVDAFHKNAWWEGVIFDHNDGSNKRLVFFPDLSDEMTVLLKKLRVTQDWDAASDEWKIRGDWIFLQIVEELKVELPVFVDIKQIWYEVRMKNCFVTEMKEWTCPVKENWKDTVKEVIADNFKLTMADFFNTLKFSDDIKNHFFDSTLNIEDDFHFDVNLLTNPDTFLHNEKEVVKKDANLKTNHVKSSSKRARNEVSPTFQTPRTVLSWLIDNNVVLPRAKVQYNCQKNGSTMKEGRVTRDGIICNCCKRIFSLFKFQKHAGIVNGRPSANIFLEDSRSLLDCQLQLKLEQNARLNKNRDEIEDESDYICSVCQYGGDLLLCDQCPSTFHTSCVGLKEVPDGEWFCPSCCCRVCNKNRFSESCEHNMDGNILTCEQCEKRYHIGCLKRTEEFSKIELYFGPNWFCSLRCEEICTGLRNLLGKSIPVGVDNLTWTLRKNQTFELSNYNASEMEELIENYSKLNVAISVMNECFEPVKEARTGRDIVEDVIFCKRSELRRLNFKGFYTILLEKDDELISTAVVRVYGDKVAEVPLVGTRFQYRRRGMCHILIQELETKLKELGVERLVLPAVPSVLHTWTKSFGLSVMTESAKSEFLGCTFLDFQGTTMCHKLLMNDLPSTKPSLSRGNSCVSIIDLEESQTSNPRKGKNNVNTGVVKCYQRRFTKSKCYKIRM